MTAGEIVGIYAAVASTCALGWQVYSWKRSRSTRVEVLAEIGMTVDPPETLVTVTVINSSEHPVRVASCGLDLQDGSEGQLPMMHQANVAGTVPGTVPARDAGTGHFYVQEVQAAGIDLDAPLTAYAWLSTGRRLTSRPTILKLHPRRSRPR
ncbi:hypothetical protein VSS74_01610 [Conexibacter stalactiti]|uniref:DUF4352 domain-containing protein n=1 Tax=Conexibacter stalactiti TaxID=1940611 RepID=A0ABU4HKE0_9ACTN|nr:hypothetical protein [Conexibacter stalactiti]MDW5593015.1 hypothetical protein [Conexibacter stalactiti]MEC5033656.1 hypothetical protein [Conexibacter stalactiti]